MNTKKKGAKAERRCMAILEQAGYACTRSGASLGYFDVIGIGPSAVRCVQVKSGGEYLSGVEREAIQSFAVPSNVTKECWRFPNRCRQPLIEVIP